MAAPGHMPAIACAPHRAHRPSGGAIVVAVRTGCRRHHNPAAVGVDQVGDEVVWEVFAPRVGHREVLPRASDKRRFLLAPKHRENPY